MCSTLAKESADIPTEPLQKITLSKAPRRLDINPLEPCQNARNAYETLESSESHPIQALIQLTKAGFDRAREVFTSMATLPARRPGGGPWIGFCKAFLLPGFPKPQTLKLQGSKGF